MSKEDLLLDDTFGSSENEEQNKDAERQQKIEKLNSERLNGFKTWSELETNQRYKLTHEISLDTIGQIEDHCKVVCKPNPKTGHMSFYAHEDIVNDKGDVVYKRGDRVANNSVLGKYISDNPTKSASYKADLMSEITGKPARDEQGRFTNNNATHEVAGFEVSEFGDTVEVKEAKRALARYMSPQGHPLQSPLTGPEAERFQAALYATGKADGGTIQYLHGEFLELDRNRKANTVDRATLVAMSPEDFEDLTKGQKAKSTLQNRFATERAGEGWSKILSERTKVHKPTGEGPFAGTAMEGIPSDVRDVMLRKGISQEAAENLIKMAKAKGWKKIL